MNFFYGAVQDSSPTALELELFEYKCDINKSWNIELTHFVYDVSRQMSELL